MGIPLNPFFCRFFSNIFFSCRGKFLKNSGEQPANHSMQPTTDADAMQPTTITGRAGSNAKRYGVT